MEKICFRYLFDKRNCLLNVIGKSSELDLAYVVKIMMMMMTCFQQDDKLESKPSSKYVDTF